MFKHLFSPKSGHNKHIQSASNLHLLQNPYFSYYNDQVLPNKANYKPKPIMETENPANMFAPIKHPRKDSTKDQALNKESKKRQSKQTFLQVQFLKGKTSIRQKQGKIVQKIKTSAYQKPIVQAYIGANKKHQASNSSDSCKSDGLFFIQSKKISNRLAGESMNKDLKKGSQSADIGNIIKTETCRNNNVPSYFVQGTKKKMYSSPLKIFSAKDNISVNQKQKVMSIDENQSLQNNQEVISPTLLKCTSKTQKKLLSKPIFQHKFSDQELQFGEKYKIQRKKKQSYDYQLGFDESEKQLTFKRFNSEVQKTSSNSNTKKLFKKQSTFYGSKKITSPQSKNILQSNKAIDKLKTFKKVNTPQYKSSNDQPNQLREYPGSLHHIKSEKRIKFHQQFAKKFVKNSSNSKQISSTTPTNKKLIKKLILNPITLEPINKNFEFIILRTIIENDKTSILLVLQTATRMLCCLKLVHIKVQVNLKDFIKQYKIQSFISNPSSVKCFAALQDNNNKKNFYILMEYMESESLMHELRKNLQFIASQKQSDYGQIHLKKSFIIDKTEHIRSVIYQILKVVQQLHSKNIIHRDIKPGNIFVSSGNYKLGDYGSSTFKNSQQCIGTLDYAAPEILLQKSYDSSIDIWSVGCIAYQMQVGYPPFFHQSHQQTMKKIYELKYDLDKIGSSQLKDFISKILQLEPKSRLTIDECLNHNFITKAG